VACRFHDPPNDDLVLLPVQPAAEERVNVNSRYLCLVYEEAKIDSLPERELAVIGAEQLEYLDELEQSGYYVAAARLQSAAMAATVRVRDGSVFISGGSEGETKERLGAFYLIDARDLNDAIRIAAKMPAARLGWIDVLPLEECD
jgi:hypothetical protein